MSYLVLARKYRPQSFGDLVGQEHVSQTLTNAMNSGRIHHAFLFTGARGVGKTSAARIFAKALNCEEGLSPQPCNRCVSCQEIAAGQGLDVFEIDGASNTGVDDIRELRENIRYLPSRSRFKIFIIDEVHMLSINAFNALLKTLEEPPEHAKFIFATTEPHKIPVTILSRCQRFDFRKIPLASVALRLREIATAENIAISDRSLSLVARRGEGSMRDALSTFDQVIAFCGGQVTDEAVQGLLGLVDRRLLFDTVEGTLARDSRRVLDAVRRVDDLGHSFRQFCQELVDIFRSLVLLKVLDQPEELLDVTPDELGLLQGLAEGCCAEDLQRIMTVLMRAEADLAVSSFPRLTLEMILVRLTYLPPAKDVSVLLRKIEDLERRLGQAGNSLPSSATVPERMPSDREDPAEAKKKSSEPVSEIQPETSEGDKRGGGRRQWEELVRQVRQARPRIGTMLEHGRLIRFEPPELEIGFSAGSFHLEQMKDPETLAVLQGLAKEFCNQPMVLKIVAVNGDQEGSIPRSLIEERQSRVTARRQKLEEEARSHPMVRAAGEIFGGEIVEIRPLDPDSQAGE
ncbi:MAG: DNA polymerase III subunit gamma/tau [Syntrophotaleaceae bacterium]